MLLLTGLHSEYSNRKIVLLVQCIRTLHYNSFMITVVNFYIILVRIRFTGGVMKRFFQGFFVLFLLAGSADAQQILSLQECINIAFDNNSQILNATHELNTTEAQKLASYNNILPSISLSGGPNRSHRGPSTDVGYGPIGQNEQTGEIIYGKTVQTSPSNTVTSYSFGLSLNQTIWDQGRMWRNIQQAESNVRSSQLKIVATRMTLIADVKAKFYDLAKVLEQREVRVESVSRAEEQLSQSVAKYKIGTVAQIDIFRSQVNVDQQKIALIDHDLLINQAKKNLNLAMGRDSNVPLNIDTNFPLIANYLFSETELVEKALRNSPDIKQQEELLVNSDLGITIAKANRYPSLSYNISYSRFNSELELLYTDLSSNFSVRGGINLSYNLFDGFQTRANIRQAENTFMINEETLESTVRTTKSNVTNLFEQLTAFQKKIEINVSMVAAAEEDLRLANERYRVGSGTLYETIDAQVALTTARYSLLELQYNALIAESNLQAAVGESGLE